jgi:hypothetical protein
MFFIRHNQVNSGPFTQDEVLSQRLTDDMLVWQEGKPWRKISEVPELVNSVIKTPPPAPDEEEKEKITSLKNKETWNIIRSALITGVVIAAIVAWITNELTYINDWPAQYTIFHSSEEMNNHLLTYPQMFIFSLFIIEIILLAISGVRIASQKKRGADKTKKVVDTDKGQITVIQYSDNINIGDQVLKEHKPAPDGTYIFTFSYYYVSINVYCGLVSFVKQKSIAEGIFEPLDPL